jgi:hypothetical protein
MCVEFACTCLMLINAIHVTICLNSVLIFYRVVLFALYYGSINKIRGKWFMNCGMDMLFLKAYVFVVNA